MFSIKRLYELQTLDWEVASHEKSLAEVRARLADDSEMVSARNLLEGLESELTERVPSRRRAEVAVQQIEGKLRSVEDRLYGGSVTNPREFSASEDERNLLQIQRGDEENRLLELMVEIEEFQSSLNEARQHLSQLEAERKLEHAELLKTEERLTGQLDQLRLARDKMIPGIPESTLSVYESLLKSGNGHAVAKVERGMCQGCRLALPTMELQRARSSQGIVQCSSCRRILYFD